MCSLIPILCSSIYLTKWNFLLWWVFKFCLIFTDTIILFWIDFLSLLLLFSTFANCHCWKLIRIYVSILRLFRLPLWLWRVTYAISLFGLMNWRKLRAIAWLIYEKSSYVCVKPIILRLHYRNRLYRKNINQISKY